MGKAACLAEVHVDSGFGQNDDLSRHWTHEKLAGAGAVVFRSGLEKRNAGHESVLLHGSGCR